MPRFITRRLGQNFLVNREIALAEAEHAHEKVVLEIGPGHGILTRELCNFAKQVIAVEKDKELYDELRRSINSEKLKLIHADFLKLKKGELDAKAIDIVISNIPYSISSSVIKWLAENDKQAVLCLQKEFVESMLAKEGTRQYSKLSVISALSFNITEIMEVSKGNFSPVPAIDSEIIYIRPKKPGLTSKQEAVVSALMQHKKKTVRKALIDSRAGFNATKEEMDGVAEKTGEGGKRVFAMSPSELLSLADKINKIQKE